MGNFHIILAFIYYSSINFGLIDSHYHSPCTVQVQNNYRRNHWSSPSHNLVSGYCVPNRACCSSFHYNDGVDIGTCIDQELCCTTDVRCQKCLNGFKEKNNTCLDINECEEVFGVCSGHKCNNTIGSYECECFDNFEMIGNLKTCRHINHSEIFDLLFTQSSRINLIKFNETDVKKENIQMLYSGTVYPKSIDYSFNGNYMAWTDTSTGMINIAPVNYRNPSLVPERTMLRNFNRPYTLTIDWMHDLIYWTDLESRAINVLNIYKPYVYYTVVNTTNQIPNDLKVNVLDSCLVWTYIGSKPRIMRSFQDGTNQSVLYSSDKQPFYLTIDAVLRRYFFVDTRHDKLISISFEGFDEKLIVFNQPDLLSKLISSPIIYKDDIFLPTYHSITSYNKFGLDGIKSKTLNIIGLLDFKIMDPLLQPKVDNKCRYTVCSHICVPSDTELIFRCLCPKNYILVNNSICFEKQLVPINSEKNLEVLINKSVEHILNKTIKIEIMNTDSEKNLHLLLNKTIDKTFELINMLNKDPQKDGNHIILTLIFILLIFIILLLIGFKFNLFKIKTPKCLSQSHPLYERSNENSIEDIESKM